MQEQIEERILHLERIFGIGSDSVKEPISTRVLDLCKRFNEISSFESFWETYKEKNLCQKLEQLEIAQSRSSLNTDTKLQLLYASQSRILAQSKLLEQLNKLVEFINPDPLQQLLQVDFRDLQRIQAEQYQAARIITSQLESLQQQYNRVMELLSARFLQLDGQLTEWETLVNQKLG